MTDGPGTAAEHWLIEKLAAFFNPRMFAWLMLTIICGLILYFVVDKGAAVGSLLVTIFNASALGFIGYRVSIALEGGVRPHDVWDEAVAAGQQNELERRWQLEQLADSMQKRRTIIVAACIVGATFLKF